MAKAWTDFYKWVLPHVKGAHLPMVDVEILSAAIEFLEGSRVWTADTAAQTVSPNVATYTPAAPAGASVVRFEEVRYDGKPIGPSNPSELETIYTSWRTVTGTPIFWLGENDPGIIRLVPIPDASLTNGLATTASLTLANSATSISDDLWEHYGRDIAKGAVAKLLASPDKPYSNPAAALEWGAMFQAAIDAAAFRVQTGHNRSRVRRINRRRFL